jgi:hypothetical protein
MKQNSIVIIGMSAIMLFSPGCFSEPGIGKSKFSELNRIAQDLKAAIASGKPCDVPETALQKFAAETKALNGKTASKAENDLIQAYSHLLTTYRDGLLLCKYQTPSSQFQFVPKGRVYVFQELDPLVQKYGLPTESHVYKPTGAYWRSIAGDSIKVIWESADSQIKNIEVMMKYN